MDNDSHPNNVETMVGERIHTREHMQRDTILPKIYKWL